MAAGKKKGRPNGPSENCKDVEAQPTRPRWPVIQPLQATRSLNIQVVSEDQIVTIPDFWTYTQCKSYVNFLAGLPLSTTPGKPRKGEAVRVNDRFQVEDPVFAENLWSKTGLRDLVLSYQCSDRRDTDLGRKASESCWGGQVLGLSSNIRVYRYRKGQFFDKHCK